MLLTAVVYGHHNIYWCNRNLINCSPVTSHPDDGACIIVEEQTPNEVGVMDLTGNLFYTEASCLSEPYLDELLR